MKEICGTCKKKVAIWCYMPGFSSGENPHFCNDCVPRGCECNHRYVDVNTYEPPLENEDLPTEKDKPIKWIEEGKVWCTVDEQGREFPCCEFWHDEDGWEIED